MRELKKIQKKAEENMNGKINLRKKVIITKNLKEKALMILLEKKIIKRIIMKIIKKIIKIKRKIKIIKIKKLIKIIKIMLLIIQKGVQKKLKKVLATKMVSQLL